MATSSSQPVYLNSMNLLGGAATLYKNGDGTTLVCVYAAGSGKPVLVHSEPLPTVAAGKEWRMNNAAAYMPRNK